LILRNIHDSIEMFFTISNLPNYDFYFYPVLFPLDRPVLNRGIFALIDPIRNDSDMTLSHTAMPPIKYI